MAHASEVAWPVKELTARDDNVQNQNPAASRSKPVRRNHLAVSRYMVACALTLSGLAGITGCAHSYRTCAGQCGPPYQLEVNFPSATSAAVAQNILTSCADHNPAVVSVGKLRKRPGDWHTAVVYTHVMSMKGRTGRLINCLRASGKTAGVSWPG